MNIRRLKQICFYGWRHATEIAEELHVGRMAVFVDILRCYFKYGIWSNQYKKMNFYALPTDEREAKGRDVGIKNSDREKWLKTFFENFRFIRKWSSIKWDMSPTRQARRAKAYAKRYNMGEGCQIGRDVVIDRHHYKWGTIKVGDRVLISRHVYIDYTGDVVIESDVKLTNGVIIESHHRDLEAYNRGENVNVPTKLVIRERAYVGSRAIILDSCSYIGKNARIGAGAVVTKDVPDNAVAVGVPAKVVKFIGGEG